MIENIENRYILNSKLVRVIFFLLFMTALCSKARAVTAKLQDIRLLRRDRVSEMSFQFDNPVQYKVKRSNDSLMIIFIDAVSGVGKNAFEFPQGSVYKWVKIRGKQMGHERLLGATIKIDRDFAAISFNIVYKQPNVLSLITLQNGEQKVSLWSCSQGLAWEYELLDVPDYEVDMKLIGQRAKRDSEARLAENTTFNINENREEHQQETDIPEVEKNKIVNTPHEPLIVIADEVNFRSSSSAKGEVLGRLSLGESLEYVSEENEWIHFRRGGSLAWIHRRFIRDSSKVTDQQWKRIKAARVSQISLENDNIDIDEQLSDLPLVENVADSVQSTGLERVIRYTAFGRDPFMALSVDSLSPTGRPFVENLKLVGILFDNFDKLALTEDIKNGKRPFALRENDPVEHGKVLKIYRDRVVFLITEYGISRSYTMRLTSTSREQEMGIR